MSQIMTLIAKGYIDTSVTQVITSVNSRFRIYTQNG